MTLNHPEVTQAALRILIAGLVLSKLLPEERQRSSA